MLTKHEYKSLEHIPFKSTVRNAVTVQFGHSCKTHCPHFIRRECRRDLTPFSLVADAVNVLPFASFSVKALAKKPKIEEILEG
ncbi:hypothetical protein HAX54_017168, partial [Datura stramonium]|nr:hypothetical protein [Datura stramonium]